MKSKITIIVEIFVCTVFIYFQLGRRVGGGITKSGAMVFIFNLDKVLLKKLFPTMNIKKVRIINIENQKCANVRK